jgi:hypothetical protein
MPSIPGARPVRLAVLAVAVALAAVLVINPWDGEDRINPATELLQRAQAAALDSRLVERLYVQLHTEERIYEDQSVPLGTPDASDTLAQEIWWESPTLWRFESSMEYLEDGKPVEPEPGWLKGGVTVADGADIWTFTDIEPGEAAAPEDLNHPQTHVREMNKFDRTEPASFFAFPSTFLTGREQLDISNMLGLLEECFDAQLDAKGEVAGREAQVVRLIPHGIGDRLPNVIDAGGCMSVVRSESSAGGDRIADQELMLWIDTEHFFILRAEQVVRSHDSQGTPFVSIYRSEVTELEMDPDIPPERFQFTPPPDLPVIDDR